MKVYYSRFIIPVPLDCKYLEEGCSALRPSFHIELHFCLFTLFMYSSDFLSILHLSCLSSLSGCVSNIVQCSMWENLIKRKKKMELLGQQRSEQFSILSHLLSMHIPPPNLIHVLFFYISCVYMYSASVCPVVNISLPAYLLSGLNSPH